MKIHWKRFSEHELVADHLKISSNKENDAVKDKNEFERCDITFCQFFFIFWLNHSCRFIGNLFLFYIVWFVIINSSWNIGNSPNDEGNVTFCIQFSLGFGTKFCSNFHLKIRYSNVFWCLSRTFLKAILITEMLNKRVN